MNKRKIDMFTTCDVLLLFAKISDNIKNSYITEFADIECMGSTTYCIPTGLPLEYYSGIEDFETTEYELKSLDTDNKITYFYENNYIEVSGDELFVDDMCIKIEKLLTEEVSEDLELKAIKNSMTIHLSDTKCFELLEKTIEKYDNVYVLTSTQKILHEVNKNNIHEIKDDVRVIYAFNNNDEYFVFDNEKITICSNKEIEKEFYDFLDNIEK